MSLVGFLPISAVLELGVVRKGHRALRLTYGAFGTSWRGASLVHVFRKFVPFTSIVFSLCLFVAVMGLNIMSQRETSQATGLDEGSVT